VAGSAGALDIAAAGRFAAAGRVAAAGHVAAAGGNTADTGAVDIPGGAVTGAIVPGTSMEANRIQAAVQPSGVRGHHSSG
jgi:hypothetical protein